ncbi:MAG: NAD(P)/FAD-dependent oxidoreductase [Cytophagales bacterium]
MKIAVIGGGASGFFAAINIKIHNLNYEVIIYEKTQKILSKVAISGGGRCNVTNSCDTVKFSKSYPRGEKFFKNLYLKFNNSDIITWFKNHNVTLKTEDDGRIFPTSNSSQTIIDCFLKLSSELDIKILKGISIEEIVPLANGFELCNSTQTYKADKVILCIGGGNNRNHYQLIHKLGHNIIEPLPSLFTFNIIDKDICNLMGISVQNALIKIQKTKLENTGDILITHWGFSGPGVIKLSAFAAQVLHEKKYEYEIKINWINIVNEEEVRKIFQEFRTANNNKFVHNSPLFKLPNRLWVYFCTKSEISEKCKWSELSNKSLNKLIDSLTNSIYPCKGKTTFKEEFVTCGGIDLAEIDSSNMESKKHKGLFFAGEVINIDGVTGGFNFQNAWTTAYTVATNISKQA